jgi:predicted membrane protein
MDGTALLLWGVLFGSVGVGFFIYGRRQRAPVHLVTGIALFLLPYFISNVYLLVAVGAALAVLPYFVRL